jgi:hypothetical protein
VAGPHRPCANEALLAAPDGWSEDVPVGLEEGLHLRDGPRRRRIGRERPRPGDPRVPSAPPAGLHLAHDHPEWAAVVGMDEATAAAWRAEARSKVAFDIEDVGHGVVKLTVTHDGFAPGSVVLPAISEGWPAVLAGLKTLLETGRPCAPRERPRQTTAQVPRPEPRPRQTPTPRPARRLPALGPDATECTARGQLSVSRRAPSVRSGCRRA